MKVTILYDNCLSKQGLKSDWGFSCLIETESRALILFDTGVDGATLLYNMKQLGIDPGNIGAVVISHAHGDHIGGLRDILEVNRDAEIYLPASVRQPIQISEGVFSTGELKGIEQSLALSTDNGIVVVTGCAHPGVGAILNVAAEFGEVCGIIGGLHGFSDLDRLQGLSLICPCHCTQYKLELRLLFPEQYITCGAGLELEL